VSQTWRTIVRSSPVQNDNSPGPPLSKSYTALACIKFNPCKICNITEKTISLHKQTHTQPFYGPYFVTTWVSRCDIFLDFMVQWKITEADTPTIQLGASPSALISDSPPSSPILMPDALTATTLPIYPGLGQAPNMLACIPSGLVP